MRLLRAGYGSTRRLNCGVMRHSRRTGDARTETLALAGLAAVVLSSVAGCCSPMSCKPAVVGMERYDPLVKGLAAFQQDRGRYPGSLEELVPTYVPAVRGMPINDRPIQSTVRPGTGTLCSSTTPALGSTLAASTTKRAHGNASAPTDHSLRPCARRITSSCSDRDTSARARARRVCVTSLCTRAALHTAARGR
jgi:hypothetical protein